MAAAYLAAHRAGHGEDAVELHKVPEPVTSDHAESLDAAACDPHAAGLYLAAAAHLNAWWQDPGDPSDPRPDLAAPAPA